MICQKCVDGEVMLGEVYYDEEFGYNTGGFGVFVGYQTERCECCNGDFLNCEQCKLEYSQHTLNANLEKLCKHK